MKQKLTHQILEHAQVPGLLDLLSEQLPGTALNSLLLEIFHRKTNQLQPSDVLKAYTENRFVRPSSAPFFDLLKIKTDLLTAAADAGFEPLQLSPVSPLGTCSVVGLAHQDKILSATRGTEAVADATNVLALESAIRRKGTASEQTLRFCAAHRHLRTQIFDFEGFTPHFDAFCMTSAGRAKGGYSFEKEAIADHLGFYHRWLCSLPNVTDFRAVFTPFSEKSEQFCREMLPGILENRFPIEIKPTQPVGYYRFLRCKILGQIKGQELEVGDAGFTDWTARLVSDRKERFFISGIGVELVAKMLYRAH